MPEVESSLGNMPDDMLRTFLSTEWRVPVSNVSTLKEMVAGCQQVNKDIGAATLAEFKEVDFEVARLSNLVGTRSNDMDPVTIFRAIRDVTSDVFELTIQINNLKAEAAVGRSADARSEATTDFECVWVAYNQRTSGQRLVSLRSSRVWVERRKNYGKKWEWRS
jgi:hypothetical protein